MNWGLVFAIVSLALALALSLQSGRHRRLLEDSYSERDRLVRRILTLEAECIVWRNGYRYDVQEETDGA